KSQQTAAPPSPVAFNPAVRGLDAQAPSPSASGVRTALAGVTANPQLGTLHGLVIDPATKTVLWQQNSSAALMPASTGKLLVSAAALLSMDHNKRFVTRVVAGDQPGTAVLIGGGDPTLNSLPG